MKPAQSSQPAGEPLPQAKQGKDWKSYLWWLVPLAALLLAGWFIYEDVFRKGPTLHITFNDATGLQEGKSDMEYRGATIGDVTKIRLTNDARQAEVTVKLHKGAEQIACEGSQFWIVKAQVGVAKVTGLTTIVSGDYITVQPGRGKSKTDFQGLDDAPIVPKQGALRILLLTERKGGMQPGAPVFYRGVQVGQVAGVELGPRSQAVQLNLDIQPRYAPLVRMNSVFWNAGGIDFNLTLSGADIRAQSAKTLLSGGIDFATPDTSEKQAYPGTSFRLFDKAQDKWLAWSPAIDLQPAPAKGPTTRQTARR